MRRLAGLISSLLSTALLAGLALVVFVQAVEAPGPSAAPTIVDVPRGAGLTGVSDRLAQAGVIDSPRLFAAAAVLRGASGRLQAGEYRFPATASMVDVLQMLTDGGVLTYQITVPEGWTSAQVVAALNATEELTGAVVTIPAEGTLLPETYRFRRGDTRAQLLDRMAEAQQAALTALWDARMPDLPLDTPEQAVTLASIVERETAVAEERALVAGVFVNRLNQGMRLQSDPTVAYAITGGRRPLDRPLTRRDIETTESPYNTYRVDGLPPGPIANPGAAALEAALNPVQTDYLYFVADGSGGHAFAETLAEHNRNVAAWRALNRGAATPPTRGQ